MSNRILMPGKSGKPPAIKVMVCMPYYGGFPDSMIMLQHQLIRIGIPGYEVEIVLLPSTVIVFTRQDFADLAIEKGYDYLFFVDADQGFDKEVMSAPNPTGLPICLSLMQQILDHRLNICGGLYVSRGKPHIPNVFIEHNGANYKYFDYPDGGVHEVSAIGTGFLCIKVDVFREFERVMEERECIRRDFEDRLRPRLEAKTNDPDMKDLIRYLDMTKPDIHPAFWIDWIKDKEKGKYMPMGEDVYFCTQARKLGYKVYCDFDVAIGHRTELYITPEMYEHAYKKSCLERHFRRCKELGIESPFTEKVDEDGRPEQSDNDRTRENAKL